VSLKAVTVQIEAVRIYLIQYFIERGPCRSEREIGLEFLVGEPWLRKTGDQGTPSGIYHSHPPPPSRPTLRAGCDRMGQATSPNSHLATGSEEESSFCEIRRRSAPSGGRRRLTPSRRSRRSSARSGRSQQVVDSAQPKQ
jgi:hypothetical protein